MSADLSYEVTEDVTADKWWRWWRVSVIAAQLPQPVADWTRYHHLLRAAAAASAISRGFHQPRYVSVDVVGVVRPCIAVWRRRVAAAAAVVAVISAALKRTQNVFHRQIARAHNCIIDDTITKQHLVYNNGLSIRHRFIGYNVT